MAGMFRATQLAQRLAPRAPRALTQQSRGFAAGAQALGCCATARVALTRLRVFARAHTRRRAPLRACSARALSGCAG